MINPLRSEREAFRFLLYVIAVAAAVVLVALATRAIASPAGAQRTLQSGTMANGSWEMLGERARLQGRNGVCLELIATFDDGSIPGRGTACAYGSLRASGNVFHGSTSSVRGSETTSRLVGGVVTSRARTVRYTFADGKTLRLRTRRPPAGFRGLLGTRVRTFAGDALAVTTARIRYVRGYDRRGRKVADSRDG